MSPRELDEDDVRVRAGAGSRRRTRERPTYADAVRGRVTTIDRGRFTCLVDDTPVIAMRSGDLRRTPIVVGDDVWVDGDSSGGPDALARIVRLDPRSSLLRRTADDTDPIERPVVANVDQVVVVVALADPPPRPRLVDRCLVAAYDAGLDTLLCLTKHDLAEPGDFSSSYEPLGVPTLVTCALSGEGLPALAAALHGRTSVLVGHSGVGKSVLVNALAPSATRRVGDVTAMGRGRHTSVTVMAFPLEQAGWVIDTPGIRSFGLGHVTASSLLRAFPDLQPGAAECLPHCEHGVTDAELCGVSELVAGGRADPARLDSYRRLLAARTAPPDG